MKKNEKKDTESNEETQGEEAIFSEESETNDSVKSVEPTDKPNVNNLNGIPNFGHGFPTEA